MKMPRIFAAAKDRIRAFVKDESGSEVVEVVYSVAMLCALILSSMLILGYALQTNQVSYAAKRITRYIEVSGQANQDDLDVLLHELLPNWEDLFAEVEVELPAGTSYVNSTDRTIQLRDKFRVTVYANYSVTLANPGNWDPLMLSVPIQAAVEGQSEAYWKT